MILTTTDTVPGSMVVTTLGMVVACIPYFGTKYGEGIGNLRGETAPDVPAVLERRRMQVLDRLTQGGEALGADAIVAIRMDTREITATWKELCAYGTAVRVRS